MLFLYILIIPFIYYPLKLLLYWFTLKYGKISYQDFDAAGFLYDPNQDIFYASHNAWQRNFGYGQLYDIGAPLFNIINDVEPIRFYYDNKNWLITFWKGQYGITTGAEIGIYQTKEQKINKKTLFLPVDDAEMIDMSFTLYKKNNKILEISDRHWWLAAFKLGMFSKPKHLVMDIKLTFANQDMLKAFLKSFQKKHHKRKDYQVNGNTFCFTYKKPHTKKVWTRNWLIDKIRQHINRKNVSLYNNFIADLIVDNKTNHTKIITLNNYIPEFLHSKKRLPKKLNNTIFINAAAFVANGNHDKET